MARKGVSQFFLDIGRESYLRYYQGAAHAVIVRDTQGKNIQFPASFLQTFIRHDGIYGFFEIEYDLDTGKCICLRQLK